MWPYQVYMGPPAPGSGVFVYLQVTCVEERESRVHCQKLQKEASSLCLCALHFLDFDKLQPQGAPLDNIIQ